MKKMRENWVPESCDVMAAYLKSLRKQREELKAAKKSASRRRKPLTPLERRQILRKTENRCHICGGQIDGAWEADHVLAHSVGGEHSIDNYLPAHRVCNNYRWNYLPPEFQEILRMGVWLRTQVENQSTIGKQAGDAFVQYEKGRISRRTKRSESDRTSYCSRIANSAGVLSATAEARRYSRYPKSIHFSTPKKPCDITLKPVI